MEISIVISVLFGITGLILSAYQIIQTNLSFHAVSKKRSKKLDGSWEGRYVQFDKLDYLNPEGTISMNLKAGKRRISGTVTLTFDIGPNRSDSWRVKGGFKAEKFLEISFLNTDDGVVQFGSLLLELDNLGKTMTGRVQGFGPESKSVVSGTLTLTKKE